MRKRDLDPQDLLARQGYLSVMDLARYLKIYAPAMSVSHPVLYRMAHDGKIKATEVGGQFRILQDEIERYIREGNRIPPPPGSGEETLGHSDRFLTDGVVKVKGRRNSPTRQPSEGPLSAAELIKAGRRYREEE